MTTGENAHVFAIERPDARLWTYYILSSLLLGPLFFAALLPLYFRYHTMHYRFDQEGISMGWGILFRREIHLTYSRIQDIHLVANFVERWLGLARIQIQTASGSAKAEMTLEGLLDADSVRDFLYSRMRGARDAPQSRPTRGERTADPFDATLAPRLGDSPSDPAAAVTGHELEELAAVLSEVAAELRELRLALAAGHGLPGEPRDPPAGPLA